MIRKHAWGGGLLGATLFVCLLAAKASATPTLLYDFRGFGSDDSYWQCGNQGLHIAGLDQWGGQAIVDTDSRKGGCSIAFAILDPDDELQGWSFQVNFRGNTDGDPTSNGQCLNPSSFTIPIIKANAHDGVTWSPTTDIDTDERKGGCLLGFRVSGPGQSRAYSLDVRFIYTGQVTNECGGAVSGEKYYAVAPTRVFERDPAGPSGATSAVTTQTAAMAAAIVPFAPPPQDEVSLFLDMDFRYSGCALDLRIGSNPLQRRIDFMIDIMRTVAIPALEPAAIEQSGILAGLGDDEKMKALNQLANSKDQLVQVLADYDKEKNHASPEQIAHKLEDATIAWGAIKGGPMWGIRLGLIRDAIYIVKDLAEPYKQALDRDQLAEIFITNGFAYGGLKDGDDVLRRLEMISFSKDSIMNGVAEGTMDNNPAAQEAIKNLTNLEADLIRLAEAFAEGKGEQIARDAFTKEINEAKPLGKPGDVDSFDPGEIGSTC